MVIRIWGYFFFFFFFLFHFPRCRHTAIQTRSFSSVVTPYLSQRTPSDRVVWNACRRERRERGHQDCPSGASQIFRTRGPRSACSWQFICTVPLNDTLSSYSVLPSSKLKFFLNLELSSVTCLEAQKLCISIMVMYSAFGESLCT